MGRVFDLSSFPPPDQYLFLPRSCYHSLMNTSSSPNYSPNCAQPSAFNRPCPRVSESASALGSSVPSVVKGLNVFRLPVLALNLARPPMRHPPQSFRSRLSTVDYRLPSNRESKPSQKMLSASQFATYNFLIGNNFNISRSPSPAVAPIPLPPSKLLDFSLTSPKSATSEFLIDNFQRVSSRNAMPLSFASFAPFASSPSCISNRPTPRLETPVSHRKQTIAPISNRPQFVFSNFALRAPAASKHAVAKAGPWPLSSLIANETHSREESSACKHSTCKILIANEFHGCGASFPAVEGHGTSEDSETGRSEV